MVGQSEIMLHALTVLPLWHTFLMGLAGSVWGGRAGMRAMAAHVSRRRRWQVAATPQGCQQRGVDSLGASAATK